MQHLQFEKSWDKALSAQDRSYIEKVFVETKHLNGTGVIFSPIREAINHKEALLVTVLVHNFTDQPLTFNNTRLRYKIQGEVIAENEFTLPKLVIPNEVSMPWTFIFPKESYKTQLSIKNGRLEAV
ncbi:SLAP domain-containing protein [Bacillus sp. E214]|uniref:SLAP domain-containing protein n=1 Tax=Bacillus sp. E214 TaxID=2587156 RepID=UPI0011DFC9E0|nr:SLAP domain-containing protein [Bacillus sp. E214]